MRHTDVLLIFVAFRGVFLLKAVCVCVRVCPCVSMDVFPGEEAAMHIWIKAVCLSFSVRALWMLDSPFFNCLLMQHG